MKKFFSYFKQHPMLALLYVVSVVMLFMDNECGMTMMAMAAVAPGSNEAPGAIAVGGSGEPSASGGNAGLPTQAPGQATTVSNMSEMGDLIEPEVDDKITKIGSDEAVIDTIKRRVKRQVRVNSFEVDHYMIDEKRSKAFTNAPLTEGKTRAKLSFDGTDNRIFQPYYTAICKGVNGYDPTGQTELPGVDLMLFVVGKDSSDEAPIVMAVNGPKAQASDEYCTVPAIPAGTEVILLSSAAYETQKFISPDSVTPVPERMYLQKQLCNSIVSDYFNAQKKRIQFNESQVAEAIVRQFRLESCRTAWVGQPGKFKVPALDSSMGHQWDYFSKGLRWQFKRQYDLASKITLGDLINLSMVKFTGFNCSKRAVWLLGKQLLNDIQQIDLTLHKNISMVGDKVFGIECTKIHTVFGDIDLIHDPTLDALGYTNCGGLIDEAGLVRYWMKNEDSKSENVEGEEAKREVVMTIDCLCLKGYSHVWVNGAKETSTIPGAAKVITAATLPASPNINDVVILTAANGGFDEGAVVTWTGSAWIEYSGGFAV